MQAVQQPTATLAGAPAFSGSVALPSATEPVEPSPAPPTAVSVPLKTSSVHRGTAPTDSDASKTAELELLTRARHADARGDYASVLASANEHERSYPNGRLSEEREVLRIKALVALGRVSEARGAAAKFRRQFPRSVLLQKVDGMLSSLP